MLNMKVWMATFAAWMGVSFTLCVLGGVLVPGLPIRHEMGWDSLDDWIGHFRESCLFSDRTGGPQQREAGMAHEACGSQ